MRAAWFLTHPLARAFGGECQNCDSPATGFDNLGNKLCCGRCLSAVGCTCAFLATQRRIREELPLMKVSPVRCKSHHRHIPPAALKGAQRRTRS